MNKVGLNDADWSLIPWRHRTRSGWTMLNGRWHRDVTVTWRKYDTGLFRLYLLWTVPPTHLYNDINFFERLLKSPYVAMQNCFISEFDLSIWEISHQRAYVIWPRDKSVLSRLSSQFLRKNICCFHAPHDETYFAFGTSGCFTEFVLYNYIFKINLYNYCTGISTQYYYSPSRVTNIKSNIFNKGSFKYKSVTN